MATSTLNVLIICITLVALNLLEHIFGGGGDADEG